MPSPSSNGDFALPEAAALQYEQPARDKLKSDPQAALRAARNAVALVPEGFDANLALADALVATGDVTGARAAYSAMRRIRDMEPTSQAEWRPIVEKKLEQVGAKGPA
jgi:thioredoxin-like negative regulator of GroEL